MGSDHDAIIRGLASEFGVDCNTPALGTGNVGYWLVGKESVLVRIRDGVIAFYTVEDMIEPDILLYKHELCDPNLVEALRVKVDEWGLHQGLIAGISDPEEWNPELEYEEDD